MKEFKPNEIYRLFANQLESKEELDKSNAKIINDKFYKFRQRFGIKYEPKKYKSRKI